MCPFFSSKTVAKNTPQCTAISDLPAQSGIYPTLVEGLKAIFGAYLLMFVIGILSLVAMTQIFRSGHRWMESMGSGL